MSDALTWTETETGFECVVDGVDKLVVRGLEGGGFKYEIQIDCDTRSPEPQEGEILGCLELMGSETVYPTLEEAQGEALADYTRMGERASSPEVAQNALNNLMESMRGMV